MVILSDYHEDQQSSSFSFNAVLDLSNPLEFLESAFNFASQIKVQIVQERFCWGRRHAVGSFNQGKN